MKFLTILLGVLISVSVLAQNVLIQTPKEEYTFSVEVADTPKKAIKGLMYRLSLPEKSGMIFFDKTDKVWYMWMKNTSIPLDMVFFDKEGKIVKITKAVPLDLTLISSDIPVKGVLELNAGTCEKYHIEKGNILKFDFENP